MIVNGVEIPREIFHAGYAAMNGKFRIAEISLAVGCALDALVEAQLLSYGSASKNTLHELVAHLAIQQARREGRVSHDGEGVWSEILPAPLTNDDPQIAPSRSA